MLAGSIVAVEGQNGTVLTMPSQRGGDEERVLPRRPIELRIVTIGADGKPKEQFRLGEKVLLELWMTNRGTDPLGVEMGRPFFQNRPRLARDGRPVLYRTGIPGHLRAEDRHAGMLGSAIPYRLEPGAPKSVYIIDLDEWYEPLELGRYQITLRHRFWGRERPVESNTVTFEVVPE